MKFIKDFIQRYKNARLAVQQLRNNGWKFYSEFRLVKKDKDDLCIWIGNGVWFCETCDKFCNDLGHFGLFWRHHVWHFGVVPFIKRNKPKKDKSVPVLE